jgi:hypothetical protein
MFNAQTHKFIARLVLVWFALFIGAAIAAPIVHPTEMQMVCSSAGGMKMVVSGANDAASDKSSDNAQTATNMDCPLCAPVCVSLQSRSASCDHASPLAHSLHPIAAALIATQTAPPLPSRGPPVI